VADHADLLAHRVLCVLIASQLRALYTPPKLRMCVCIYIYICIYVCMYQGAMYVCMYVCIKVPCIVSDQSNFLAHRVLCVLIASQLRALHTPPELRMCVYMYVCVCMHMYTYMGYSVYLKLRAEMYVHIHICMHIHTHAASKRTVGIQGKAFALEALKRPGDTCMHMHTQHTHAQHVASKLTVGIQGKAYWRP
jgi:hypothetical protein